MEYSFLRRKLMNDAKSKVTLFLNEFNGETWIEKYFHIKLLEKKYEDSKSANAKGFEKCICGVFLICNSCDKLQRMWNHDYVLEYYVFDLIWIACI